MKKEELLKQYPDLIEEIAGEIYSQHVQSWGVCGQKTPKFKQTFNEYVEANTKEIPKDYEFLAFRQRFSSDPSGIHYLKNPKISTINDYLNSSNFGIYEIKRLSDGEIFRIGDKINGGGQIINIYLENSQMYFRIDTGVDGHLYSDTLDSIKKLKDYEILSFIRNDKNNNVASYIKSKHRKIFHCYEPHNFQYNVHDEAQLLSYDWLQIHSIKRLSDDEIFTLGDKANGNEIKEFIIENGLIVAKFDMNNGHYAKVGLNLIKKDKFFTTEDNVDVFGGETLYYINLNLGDKMVIDKMTIGKTYNLRYKEHLKYFKDYENAKEYVIQNKGILNFKEIEKIIPNCLLRDDILILLYNLIKEKLNLDK